MFNQLLQCSIRSRVELSPLISERMRFKNISNPAINSKAGKQPIFENNYKLKNYKNFRGDDWVKIQLLMSIKY